MTSCAICDRDPFDVYCCARWRDIRFCGLGVSARYPMGDGRGWLVAHLPRQPQPLLLSEGKAPSTVSRLMLQVFTCGDPICVFRARAHGVPGRDVLVRR